MINGVVVAESGNSDFHLQRLIGGNFKLSIKGSRHYTLSRDELKTLRNALSRELE